MVTKSKAKEQSNGSKAVAPAPVKKQIKVNNSNGATLSNAEAMRVLYSSLLRCRIVAEHAQELWSAADEGGMPLEFGIQDEAVVVGSTTGLQAQDTITASPSNLVALVARGVPLAALLSPRNSSDGYLGWGSITAASIPDDPFTLGTGLAFAQKLQRQENVVVAFCQHDNPSLDTWHEAMKLAAPHRLPILYVVKNGVPGKPANPGADLEEYSFMARDFGFPAIVVDGRDVVAVWRAAQESIHRARNGSGPTLIDCRMDSTQDPLAHMEHYMQKRGAWDDSWKAELSQRINAEIEEAAIVAIS